MPRIIGLLVRAFGFGCVLLAPVGAAAACVTIVKPESRYQDCSFDPAVQTIRIYSRGPDGAPYLSFRRLATQLWQERRVLVFAANAGMFKEDYSAVGLFVEHGIERAPLSTRAGWGNFHLLPNGVFYLQGSHAGVLEANAYRQAELAVDYATQSGPMLVIDGALHPRFLPDSDSHKRRNGVGVDKQGRVHFVISERAVRFYDFARLFRDDLDCDNALYLDGTISSHYVPGEGREDRLFSLGPMIGVSELVTARP